MIATFTSLTNFLVLLIIFMAVSSLIGMELFAYRVRNENESPRYNFDNFLNSMVSVFILLTNEDWNNFAYRYSLGVNSK